jgi:hypothetical protein
MNSVKGTIFEIFQLLSLFGGIGLLFIVIRRGLLTKHILLDLPIIILTINIVIYYILVFLNRYGFISLEGGATPFTFWSTVLRFLEVFCLLLIYGYAYYREVKKNSNARDI